MVSVDFYQILLVKSADFKHDIMFLYKLPVLRNSRRFVVTMYNTCEGQVVSLPVLQYNCKTCAVTQIALRETKGGNPSN